MKWGPSMFFKRAVRSISIQLVLNVIVSSIAISNEHDDLDRSRTITSMATTCAALLLGLVAIRKRSRVMCHVFMVLNLLLAAVNSGVTIAEARASRQRCDFKQVSFLGCDSDALTCLLTDACTESDLSGTDCKAPSVEYCNSFNSGENALLVLQLVIDVLTALLPGIFVAGGLIRMKTKEGGLTPGAGGAAVKGSLEDGEDGEDGEDPVELDDLESSLASIDGGGARERAAV